MLRDGGTDLLHVMFARLRFYDGIAAAFVQAISATGQRRIIDLCSGGGGGTLDLLQRHGASLGPTELELTDLHPSASARVRLHTELHATRHLTVRYADTPVDALHAGHASPAVYTMASALHHFTPEAVQSLVAARVARRQPFVFVDVAASPALRKAPVWVLPLVLPLNMVVLAVVTLVLTPLLRPRTLQRWLLTYAIPLIPLLVAWDGSISALRAYTPAELLDLAQRVAGAEGYVFAAGRDGKALWFSGHPLQGTRDG